jgi:hypothetical protein
MKDLNLDGQQNENVIQELFKHEQDSIIDGEEVKKMRQNEAKMVRAVQGKLDKRVTSVQVPHQKQVDHMVRRRKFCRQY